MILVLRALGVGDLAAGVPALRALRTHFPDRTLTLAAPAWLTPLIDLIGGVDRVLPLDSLTTPLPASLRAEVAVNLHGSGPQSHQLLSSVRPERLLAFAGPALPAGPAPATPALPGGPGPACASPFVDGASPFTGGASLFVDGASPFAGGASSLAGGASSFAGGASPFVGGASLFAGGASSFVDGPAWRDDEHERDRWCRLLAYYGIPADPGDTDLAVPDAAVPHGVTIVHPGAKSPSRRWPADRYATVAAALAAQGHHVVVTGSAAEHDLAAEVAAKAGLGPSAAPATGLAELAALVAHARLLISGDTGIAHLATAYGTPSVTLFGPMPPARWGPPPDRPWHRTIWHGTRAERGDAPGPGVHRALLAATAEEVLIEAGLAEQDPGNPIA